MTWRELRAAISLLPDSELDKEVKIIDWIGFSVNKVTSVEANNLDIHYPYKKILTNEDFVDAQKSESTYQIFYGTIHKGEYAIIID